MSSAETKEGNNNPGADPGNDPEKDPMEGNDNPDADPGNDPENDPKEGNDNPDADPGNDPENDPKDDQEGPGQVLLNLQAEPTETHRYPLSVHTAASSTAVRRQETRPYNGNHQDNGAWTSADTDRVLQGVPFDEHVGLRFYRTDPLPLIQAACAATGKRFLDHEFPTHRFGVVSIPSSVLSPADVVGPRAARAGAPSIILDDGSEDGSGAAAWDFVAVPGVVTDSNYRDFATAGEHRVRRLRILSRRAARHCRGDGLPTHSFDLEWKKYAALGDNYVLFGDTYPIGYNASIHPRNVIQGTLVGNCGFCSGLASVAAAAPHLIQGAFGSSSTASLRDCGAVSLRLYPNGTPRYLLLDENVLTWKGLSESEEFPPTMHGLAYDAHVTSKELWMRLLEKAFAKVQGSFASLDGLYKHRSLYRHPARAVQLLTGAPLAVEVTYGAPKDAGLDKATHNRLVYEMLRGTQGTYARVAHCRSKQSGLRRNHGYSLLWIGCVGGVALVCLRNPHGTEAYTGPYGHDAHGRENPVWAGDDRAALWKKIRELSEFQDSMRDPGCLRWRGDVDQGINDDDNGMFLMEFETFLRCVPIVTMVGPLRSFGREQKETRVSENLHQILPRQLVRVPELLALYQPPHTIRVPELLALHQPPHTIS